MIKSEKQQKFEKNEENNSRILLDIISDFCINQKIILAWATSNSILESVINNKHFQDYKNL